MRYMVIVKSDERSERGEMPSTAELAQMNDFNEELVTAGVMVQGEGLLQSSRGARVSKGKDGKVTVTDGPFAEAKELVGGFWILEVASLEEAVRWASKVPMPCELEVRKVAEAADFGDAFTPELAAAEQDQRDRAAAQHQG